MGRLSIDLASVPDSQHQDVFVYQGVDDAVITDPKFEEPRELPMESFAAPRIGSNNGPYLAEYSLGVLRIYLLEVMADRRLVEDLTGQV